MSSTRVVVALASPVSPTPRPHTTLQRQLSTSPCFCRTLLRTIPHDRMGFLGRAVDSTRDGAVVYASTVLDSNVSTKVALWGRHCQLPATGQVITCSVCFRVSCIGDIFHSREFISVVSVVEGRMGEPVFAAQTKVLCYHNALLNDAQVIPHSTLPPPSPRPSISCGQTPSLLLISLSPPPPFSGYVPMILQPCCTAATPVALTKANHPPR